MKTRNFFLGFLTVLTSLNLPVTALAGSKTYVGPGADFTIRCAIAGGTSSGSFTINAQKSATTITSVQFATAFNTDVTSIRPTVVSTSTSVYNSPTVFYPLAARAFYAFGLAQGTNASGEPVVILPTALYSSGCS
jgi:hypothetical protein